MAYGYQYVPRLGGSRSQRPIAERSAITSGSGGPARIHDLTPGASAVARAIDDVYRDIAALRALVQGAPDDEEGTHSAVVRPT